MKKAIEAYENARRAEAAAHRAEEAARDASRAEQCRRPAGGLHADGTAEWLERMRALDDAHTAAALNLERATRIRQAAAYIAEQKIKAAALPVLAAVLEKYKGKTAGPKTREKAAAEVAAAVGARSAYFGGNYSGRLYSIRFYFDCARGNDVQPEIFSGAGYFTDENNKFCPCDLPPVNVDGLPVDLEAWSRGFEAAAAELEQARRDFEEKRDALRRVNLGNAALPYYHISRN